MKKWIPLVAASAALASATAAKADFYTGETINCIVPYAAGGATDVFFRTVTEFLPETIPGAPTIIVQNMAGAGGILANNYVYEQADNDGMTVLCAPWLSIAQVTQAEGVRFRYDEMIPIGSAISSTGMLIRAGLIDEPAEIMERRLTLGGLQPAASNDLRQRLALRIMGVDYHYVPGFQGDAAQRPAMQRGEIDVIGLNIDAYVSNVMDVEGPGGTGTILPLWYYPEFDADMNPLSVEVAEEKGFVRFDELYEEIHGAPPSSEEWEIYKWFYQLANAVSLSMWLPEGSPDEAAEALRTGWWGLQEHEGFLEAFETRFGSRPVWSDPEVIDAALETLAVSPTEHADFIAFIQQMIEEGSD
ncbi:MAG: hypothetical protein JJU42_01550 [Rhodobacteraceae bacterium]|nr:hypothetical protein [Paracoccaceae bacterium]